MSKERRILPLPNGEEILITFTDEGIVYDRLDKYGEVVEEYGYDFYHDVVPNFNQNKDE
jgi:hypothetical protein